MDIDLILKGFCDESKDDIVAIVHHYYANDVTLSNLLLKHISGIVRRHNNKLGYLSNERASKVLLICFNYNGIRTVGSFIKIKGKDCYTMRALDIPRI